jgi:hypothetical protein
MTKTPQQIRNEVEKEINNLETGRKKFQNRKGIKNQMRTQKENINFKTEFHYTPESLVDFCLSKCNFDKSDFILDVGAGKNMVWYNKIGNINKDWCEIELGEDFFNYTKQVDWCVGNPPFTSLWEVIEKSCVISNKGFCFLMSSNCWNMFTPKRIKYLIDKGFYFQKTYVVNCKKWFGRYFFVIFNKKKNDILNYSLENY